MWKKSLEPKIPYLLYDVSNSVMHWVNVHVCYNNTNGGIKRKTHVTVYKIYRELQQFSIQFPLMMDPGYQPRHMI